METAHQTVKRKNSDSPELRATTPCVVLVDRNMWELKNSVDDDVHLRVSQQPV